MVKKRAVLKKVSARDLSLTKLVFEDLVACWNGDKYHVVRKVGTSSSLIWNIPFPFPVFLLYRTSSLQFDRRALDRVIIRLFSLLFSSIKNSNCKKINLIFYTRRIILRVQKNWKQNERRETNSKNGFGIAHILRWLRFLKWSECSIRKKSWCDTWTAWDNLKFNWSRTYLIFTNRRVYSFCDCNNLVISFPP